MDSLTLDIGMRLMRLPRGTALNDPRTIAEYLRLRAQRGESRA